MPNEHAAHGQEQKAAHAPDHADHENQGRSAEARDPNRPLVPVLDEQGNPVLDEDGNPVMEKEGLGPRAGGDQPEADPSAEQ